MEHLDSLNLLHSMYPDEVTILDPSSLVLPLDPDNPPTEDVSVNLLIQHPDHLIHTINLHLLYPFSSPSASLESSVRHDSWMTRSMHTQLQGLLSPNSDLFESIDLLRDTILASSVTSSSTPPISETTSTAAEPQDKETLKRYWFLLVSLSTRSKRNDLVNWAPGHNLTGFVLAGKPAVVCLEGRTADVEAYMSEIKSLSWADVPSHQKKISIVQTETIAQRKFAEMSEVTDLFDMGGHRGNRPDLGQVRRWMEEKGVGKLFNDVFGGPNSGFGQG